MTSSYDVVEVDTAQCPVAVITPLNKKGGSF